MNLGNENNFYNGSHYFATKIFLTVILNCNATVESGSEYVL